MNEQSGDFSGVALWKICEDQDTCEDGGTLGELGRDQSGKETQMYSDLGGTLSVPLSQVKSHGKVEFYLLEPLVGAWDCQ